MKKVFTLFLSFILISNTIYSQIEFNSLCSLITEDEIIQDINTLDGVTLSMLDTIAGFGPAPFCSGGGSAHNQNWLAFVAKEGEYKIILSASNCTEVGGFTGVQTAIYTNCSFEEDVFCQPQCNGGDTEIPSDQLIPGERYYLIVDGCAGSACDITFTIDDYLPLGCVTEWQSSVGGLGGVSSFDYQYGGDTLINGQNYRKINTVPEPDFQPTRFIREEDKKVYEYSTFNNSESKIYDFTLSVGDQLEYSSGFVGTVTNIDTTVLSSGRFTRWTLDGPGPPYSYIEGIGGDHLFYADQLGISDPVYSTSCVFKYCDKIVGLDECDSKMNWDTESNIETTICEGESIIFGGVPITDAGVYSEVFANSVGCDSISALSVSILTTGMSFIEAILCEGGSLDVNGISFDVFSPNGTIVIPNGSANGCDSIITVDLSFLPNISENYQTTICEGSSEIWAGDTITIAGDYEFVLTSVNGCDSMINLSVEVIPDIITELSFEICEGSEIDIEGMSFTTSGTYPFEFEASTGCDSVVIYYLDVLPTIETSESVEICAGDSIIVDGNILSSEGIYQTTYASFNGCDSIAILNLSLLPIIEVFDTIYFCPNDTIEAGVFQEINTGINGCDSITTLYAIELLLSDPECTTSTYDLQNFTIDISPNPFDHSIHLSSQEIIESIDVVNISGTKVDKIDNINSYEYSYRGDQLVSGIYILTVRSEDKIAIKKIVKY